MSDYGLTEAQIIKLIQRHTAQTESSSKKLWTNTQKFTKEALQYDGGKWTKSDAVNKMFVQELKNAKMDAYQSIQQRLKDGDRLRVAARGAIEVFEEIKFVVRRLVIYAFAASKSIDNEANELTARFLKLPGSARYLNEEDEGDEDDKDFVFSQEDVDRIQQARYEEAIVNNIRYGDRQFKNKGQGQYRGGFSRGRGRKNFTWSGKPKQNPTLQQGQSFSQQQ
ncbi:hypothetical protein RMATCC62417_16534 [Rhizopus microsporus]|nr:hypothetical protein RMATCC62417_01626 [Rhizopus microsporus]CEG82465.1 hypothetical protein RMATCC62417_16534 [Rhizopus microsporus]